MKCDTEIYAGGNMNAENEMKDNTNNIIDLNKGINILDTSTSLPVEKNKNNMNNMEIITDKKVNIIGSPGKHDPPSKMVEMAKYGKIY